MDGELQGCGPWGLKSPDGLSRTLAFTAARGFSLKRGGRRHRSHACLARLPTAISSARRRRDGGSESRRTALKASHPSAELFSLCLSSFRGLFFTLLWCDGVDSILTADPDSKVLPVCLWSLRAFFTQHADPPGPPQAPALRPPVHASLHCPALSPAQGPTRWTQLPPIHGEKAAPACRACGSSPKRAPGLRGAFRRHLGETGMGP